MQDRPYSNLRMGHHRIMCDVCGPTRSGPHRKDKCLSVDVDSRGVKWLCHHCAQKGAYLTEQRVSVVPLRQPIKSDERKIDTKGENWLSQRSISRITAEQMGVFQTRRYFPSLGMEADCLGFKYLDDKGHTVYIKYRAIPDKAFTSDGKCEWFYGTQDIKDQVDTIIICEGELDYLALKEVLPEQAVLSVPSGATNITAGAQIPYLWNAKPILDKAKKIYIGTDNDKAGDPFGDELARRLGRYRCWRVNWGEGCKDANDALVKNGWEGIENALKSAEPYPVDGLYSADHYFEKVDKIFDEGIGRGESTGIPGIDEYYTVLPGQLTVVSGVPNSGKSQVLDNIMINMAKSVGWKFAIASFENPPFIHIANLSSMVVEKDFFESPYGAKNRMTRDERDYAKDFVKDHFFFLQAEDGGLADLDSVLDRIKVAVLRYGIKGAVIDPYNYLSKPKDCTETEFVSEALTKIKIVAAAYGIHMWLVSHPTKLPRQSDGSYFTPGGYEISGSSNFYNKSDCGFSIGRAPEGNLSEFKVWKTRYSFTGKNGSPFILWDAMRHIYVGANPPIEDDF